MSSSESTSGGLPIPKSKRGLKGFLNEVSREIKKVNWPSRQETNRLTGIVLAVCTIIVLILTALSQVADTLVTLLTRGHIN